MKKEQEKNKIQKEKKESEIQQKEISKNSYKLMVLLMLSLLIMLPAATSYIIAQTDVGQGVIEPDQTFSEADQAEITGQATGQEIQRKPDNPGARCSSKGKQVSSFVDIMDSDVIKVLETVASIMFVICTIASAIDTIINTVYNVLGCCVPNVFNIYACTYKESEGKVWGMFFGTIVKPICCFVNCGWCSGDDSSCMGVVGEVLDAGGVLGDVPPLLDQGDQSAAGIGQFHLSPYDNIYVALGCMCPVAILFNLRKLKTIYQTYDCCMNQACEHGFSTQPCDDMLGEATCMYWEGSIYNMLIKIILSIIAKYVGDLIIKLAEHLGLMQILYCPLALWDLAQVPATIEGVKSAWEWMDQTFDEPDCADLGFAELKPDPGRVKLPDQEGIAGLTMIDRNGDGIYDGTARNYDSRSVQTTDTDFPPALKDNAAFKGVNIEEYTVYTNEGPKVYYQTSRPADAGGLFGEAPEGAAEPGIYEYNPDAEEGKELTTRNPEQLETALTGSLTSFENSRIFNQGNEIRVGDEYYTYAIESGMITLTDSRGERQEPQPLENFIGREMVIGNRDRVEITGLTENGNGFVLDDGRQVEYGYRNQAEGFQKITITPEGEAPVVSLHFDDGTIATEIRDGETITGYNIDGTVVSGAKIDNIGEARDFISSEGRNIEGASDVSLSLDGFSYTDNQGIDVRVVIPTEQVHLAQDIMEQRAPGTGTFLSQAVIEGKTVYYHYSSSGNRVDDGTWTFDPSTGQLVSDRSGVGSVTPEIFYNYDDADLMPGYREGTVSFDELIGAGDLVSRGDLVRDIGPPTTMRASSATQTRTQTVTTDGTQTTLSTTTNRRTGEATATLTHGDNTVEVPNAIAGEIDLGTVNGVSQVELPEDSRYTTSLVSLTGGESISTSEWKESGNQLISFNNADGNLVRQLETSGFRRGTKVTDASYDPSNPDEYTSAVTTTTYGFGVNEITIEEDLGAFGSDRDSSEIIVSRGEETFEMTREELGTLPQGTDEQFATTMGALLALGVDPEEVTYERGGYVHGDLDGDATVFYAEGPDVDVIVTVEDGLRTEYETRFPDGRTSWTEQTYDKNRVELREDTFTTNSDGDITDRRIQLGPNDGIIAIITADYDPSRPDAPITVSIMDGGGNDLGSFQYDISDRENPWKNKDGSALDLSTLSQELQNHLNIAGEKVEGDLRSNDRWAGYKDRDQINFLEVYRDISAAEAMANVEAAVYGLVWKLLDDTLGKFAYDKVEEYCKRKNTSLKKRKVQAPKKRKVKTFTKKA